MGRQDVDRLLKEQGHGPLPARVCDKFLKIILLSVSIFNQSIAISTKKRTAHNLQQQKFNNWYMEVLQIFVLARNFMCPHLFKN